MCSRIGSFPPALARYFIVKYSHPGDIVVDPFSGKGTAPLEACLEGRKGIGNDLAPEAFILTYAKVKPVTIEHIFRYLDDLEERLSKVHVDLESVSRDVKVFYHKETLEQILRIKKILVPESGKVDTFVKALMLGILHGGSSFSLSLHCSHSFSMAPGYVRDYANAHELHRPKRDVIECLRTKARKVLKDELPKIKGEAYQKDAIKFLSYLTKKGVSADLIVTSPPYLNTQTYAWDNWLRLWFLGKDYKKVRNELFRTGRLSVYNEYMAICLRGMYNILKDDAACFVVVGDVRNRGKIIRLSDQIAKQADKIGFKVNRIIDDFFPRGKKHFIHIEKNNLGIRDDRIVELHKGKPEVVKNDLSWKTRKPLETYFKNC